MGRRWDVTQAVLWVRSRWRHARARAVLCLAFETLLARVARLPQGLAVALVEVAIRSRPALEAAQTRVTCGALRDASVCFGAIQAIGRVAGWQVSPAGLIGATERRADPGIRTCGAAGVAYVAMRIALRRGSQDTNARALGILELGGWVIAHGRRAIRGAFAALGQTALTSERHASDEHLVAVCGLVVALGRATLFRRSDTIQAPLARGWIVV
jgi:hypothetical protein